MNLNRKKILILATTMVLFALVFFFVVYSPSQDLLKETNNHITTTQNNIKNHQEELEKIKRISELPADTKQREPIRVPSKIETALLLKEMSKVAETSQVIILLFQPNPQEQKNSIHISPYTLEVQGKFSQVVGFFDKISDPDRLMSIRNIHIQTGPVENNHQLIRARAQLTAYQHID